MRHIRLWLNTVLRRRRAFETRSPRVPDTRLTHEQEIATIAEIGRRAWTEHELRRNRRESW